MRQLLVTGMLGVAAAAAGCGAGQGTLEVDYEGKLVEVRSASELRVPKGNQTVYRPSDWKMQVRGQEAIVVVCGGQERTLYVTESMIQIDGRTFDLKAGERIVITPDGVTIPTTTSPAPIVPPAGSGDGAKPAGGA